MSYGDFGYHSFGMQMPTRTFAATNSYRYGFNGKENDNEVKGEGNQLDFNSRVYDPRVGRWYSVDAVSKPWLSSYQYGANNPINNIDADGKDEIHFHFGSSITKGASGQAIGSSHAWVEIIKTNGPDRFFHHSHITEVKLPTNYSKGGVSTFESTKEFYPWNPKSKSGITSEPVPFLSDILPDRQDRDYVTLLKYVNTFPEVENYIKSRNSTEEYSFDKEGWSGISEDRKTYSALSKITRGAEITAEVLMIIEGGLRMRPGATPKPKGMANPEVRDAVNLGNRVHYDQLNGGPSGSIGLPSELQARYPNTQFNFSRRGAKGADVEVIGGTHPSQYSGSTWQPGNNFGDFKPAGSKNFAGEIKSGKLPSNTQQLNYNKTTGNLQ